MLIPFATNLPVSHDALATHLAGPATAPTGDASMHPAIAPNGLVASVNFLPKTADFPTLLKASSAGERVGGKSDFVSEPTGSKLQKTEDENPPFKEVTNDLPVPHDSARPGKALPLSGNLLPLQLPVNLVEDMPDGPRLEPKIGLPVEREANAKPILDQMAVDASDLRGVPSPQETISIEASKTAETTEPSPRLTSELSDQPAMPLGEALPKRQSAPNPLATPKEIQPVDLQVDSATTEQDRSSEAAISANQKLPGGPSTEFTSRAEEPRLSVGRVSPSTEHERVAIAQSLARTPLERDVLAPRRTELAGKESITANSSPDLTAERRGAGETSSRSDEKQSKAMQALGSSQMHRAASTEQPKWVPSAQRTDQERGSTPVPELTKFNTLSQASKRSETQATEVGRSASRSTAGIHWPEPEAVLREHQARGESPRVDQTSNRRSETGLMTLSLPESAPQKLSSSGNVPNSQPAQSVAAAIPPSVGQSAANAPILAEAKPEPRALQSLEGVVDTMMEAREAGRAARSELSLRHHEFGAVAVRLEANGADLRATVSSRDPAFVPAVQAALADRAAVGVVESAAGQQTRGGDQSSGQQTGQNASASSNGGFDRSYGSSTGSQQGSSQPYSEQTGSADQGHTSQDPLAVNKTSVVSERDADLFA